MPSAFLTGGTGFLGRNVLERLTAAGWQVHALHRSETPPGHWHGEQVRPVRGDIIDADALPALMPEGLDAVFHIAADTSPWSGHRKRQERVNVEGTRAAIAAARQRKARKFVHVSSVSVFGHHDGLVTETTPQTGETSWVGYVRTKAIAERLVREAAADGLDATILNPAHIMGRYDSSNWARLFQLIERDALPGVPPGGGCFANVGDVADAVLAAVAKGRRGENYILGGPHARFLEVARGIADLLGKQKPERTAPAILLKTIARIHDLMSRVTGREPDITPEGAYFVCHDERVSSAKAIAELGYRETPLAQSLAECHAWLKEAGLIGDRKDS
ncbi:MAG: SDR family oxidoreductase [Rhodothalassiaceae bacterium]